MEPKPNITLALYPTSYGIGFVVCEDAQKVLDYGIKKVRPLTLNRHIHVFERLLDYAKPDLILLRNYKNDKYKVSKRTQIVLDELESYAIAHNLEVYSYSRNQIQDVFDKFGCRTKHEIAKKIVYWFSQLEQRLPPKRKAFMSEGYNMGIFDACALAMAHYYIE